MIIFFDASVLAILFFLALACICGAGYAIANFIAAHTVLLVCIAGILIALNVALWIFGIREEFKNKTFIISSSIIRIIHGIISLFAIYNLLGYFVEIERESGFFEFAFEVILIFFLGLLPIFGSGIVPMTAVGASEDFKKESTQFAAIILVQIIACSLSICSYFTLQV